MKKPKKDAVTPEQQKEYQEELWTYTGRRLGKENGIFYTYRDGDGEARWYDKPVTGTTIGGIYSLPVKRDAETVSVLMKKSGWTGKSAPGEDISEWQAHDKTVGVLVDRVRLEARVKKDRVDDMTIYECGRLVSRLNRRERRAFIALVLDRLMNGLLE